MTQIDMASGHTSLLPLQESQETSRTDLELSKYLHRKRHEESSPFCNAVLQLLQSMTGLDNFEGKNIKDVYKNQTLHGILKELTEMGACAKVDIRNKKKFERDQPKVLGLTGANIGHGSVQKVLQKTDQGTQGIYFLSDQVTPLCEFKNTEAQCQKMLGEMQSALDESRKTEWLHWLRDLGGTICEMMKAWRAYQLWIHFRLAGETDVTTTYTQFQRIFTSYFDVISNIQQRWNMQKDSLGSLISQLLECKAQVRSQAWSFEAQPPLDWNGSSKEQLHLRMFGIMKSEIDHQNVKLTVFSQSKFEERHKTRKDDFSLCGKPDKVIDCSENGLLLHFSVGAIKKPNLKNKLHFEQMLRFSIVIELLEDGHPQIECFSVPFQVRTGSSQLWAGVGAMTWASFSKPLQMANPPFKYEESLPVNQVVRMFRHMIWAVDQNKCFLEMETVTLTGMVQGVVDGGSQTVQIKKFAMDKLLGEKSEPFPCFTWFVAAQNSHGHLISFEGLQSEDLQDFLSESQCKQLLTGLPPGNSRLRLSSHQVDSITGTHPETRIAAHFFTKGRKQWQTGVSSISKIMEHSLPGILENYNNSKGEKLVHCVQPQNKSLSELSAQCKSPSQEENHNGYCRIREHAAPTTFLDDDMSNLSLTDREEPSTSSTGFTYSSPSSHKRRKLSSRKMTVKTDKAPSSCAYATHAVVKPKEEVGPNFANTGALSVGNNNGQLLVCSNLSGPGHVRGSNDPFSMGVNNGALSVGDNNDPFSVDGNSAALSVGGYNDPLSVGGNTIALSVHNNHAPLAGGANSAHLISANSNTVSAGGAVTEKAALSIEGNNDEVPGGCPSGLLPVNACPSTDFVSIGFSVDDAAMIVQSGDAFPAEDLSSTLDQEVGDDILDLLDNLDEVDFESFPPEGIPM